MNTPNTPNTTQRSCDELGLCKQRAVRCTGCSEFAFAPGVIDSGPKSQRYSWRLSDFAGAIALVAAAYFLVGCFI